MDAEAPMRKALFPGRPVVVMKRLVSNGPTLAPLLLLATACAGRSTSQAPTPVAQEYDLVIRNGRVLDGAGNPWVRADIAVKDGRIAAIGKIAGTGKREIDASGDYVSPGWVDMMDQSNEVLLKNGLAESKLRQGLTTLIDG